MVFIFSVNFNEHRLVKKCLESFYGCGPNKTVQLMAKYNIFPRAKVGSLSTGIVNAITAELSSMKVETELRKEIRGNIRRLKDMGTLRGRRHAMGLPVRGQITRSQIYNARRFNRVERIG